MFSLYNFTTLIHLIGLALGLGSATIKLMLVFRCNSNLDFYPIYSQISKAITKLIISGTLLLTLSGITWIILGYPINTILIIKMILVVFIWLLGPFIDNVIEPNLAKFAPAPGYPASSDFKQIFKQYKFYEITATLLMYIITVMGVML